MSVCMAYGAWEIPGPKPNLGFHVWAYNVHNGIRPDWKKASKSKCRSCRRYRYRAPVIRGCHRATHEDVRSSPAGPNSNTATPTAQQKRNLRNPTEPPVGKSGFEVTVRGFSLKAKKGALAWCCTVLVTLGHALRRHLIRRDSCGKGPLQASRGWANMGAGKCKQFRYR